MKVPVFDTDGKTPLMPTTPARARRWVKSKKATPFWKKGVWCVRLNKEPSGKDTQEVCVGIDPGSKFNGLTVKSAAHTYLNIQYNSKTVVKSKIDKRRKSRQSRRQRNCPNRKCRFNRKRNSEGFVPPSTKARWQQHLNMIKYCQKMFPISHVAIEDVKAKSLRGGKHWNKHFNPVQHGKNWLYGKIENELKLPLYKISGFDTYELRNFYGLKKNSNKGKEDFYSHCVDSWCIASEVVGGDFRGVDNEYVLFFKPFNHIRRKLHEECPTKGGKRRNRGGTVCLGISKGALVKHPKYGLTLVGGVPKSNRLSLHDVETNKRVSDCIRKEDLKILTNFKWNIHNKKS